MPSSQRRIEAILFDLDDTLLDWSQPAVTWEDHLRPKVRNIYGELTAQGYDLPAEEEFFARFQGYIRQSWVEAQLTWALPSFADVIRHCLASCRLDLQEIDVDLLMERFDWQPMPGITPFADAAPVLRTLRRRGYKLGLITNSLFPMWMRDIELRSYDLLDYLDVRVASGDVGYLKPHPAIYEHTLRLLDVPAGQAVFVGDRPPHDIAGANVSGLVSVLISPPHLQRPLEGVVPDFTIQSLSELLPLLEKLDVEAHEQARPE